ncbi:MAG: nuclear transport factor 2 family protein [Deltaproteobacteria bacterium]|nr:nuclear transport factor 2 family protein [Deltaproteobacteria bacterium]
MRRQTITAIIVLIFSGLMVFTGISWSGDAPAGNKSPDQAMQAFTQAMLRKDPQRLLTFFSKDSSWKYQSYEIGSNKLIVSKQVSYADLVNDFRKKTGWYGFFFDEPNGYTFRLNFTRGERWRKEGPALFIAPQSESGRTFIQWKQEGGRWVIGVISETTP